MRCDTCHARHAACGTAGHAPHRSQLFVSQIVCIETVRSSAGPHSGPFASVGVILGVLEAPKGCSRRWNHQFVEMLKI